MNKAFFCLVLAVAGPCASASVGALDNSAPAAPQRVLVVGNSLVYVNNVPALVSAMAPADAPIVTDMLIAAGGDMSERLGDGAVAREISSGRWQVLVLQERGGLLACLDKPAQRDERTCRGSVIAHKKLSQLARTHGMRVILLGTWGPDSIWQGQLSRSLRKLAGLIEAEPLDAGAQLRDFGQKNPQLSLYQDESLHLSLDGSLLVAAALYRQLSGHAPRVRSLEITAPLYPVRILPDPTVLASQQSALADNAIRPAVSAEQMAIVVESVSK